MDAVCALCGGAGVEALACCGKIGCNRCLSEGIAHGKCAVCAIKSTRSAAGRQILMNLSRRAGHCRFCEHVGEPAGWDDHFQRECPGFPVRCLLQDCGRDMERGEWPRHVREYHMRYLESVYSVPAHPGAAGGA